MLHRLRRASFILSTLTLALVVASTSAVLAVVDATMVRPLPFADSARLVRVYMQPPGTSDFAQANPLSAAVFARAREQSGSLSGIEGIWTAERAVGGAAEPESVPGARVSNGFFSAIWIAVASRALAAVGVGAVIGAAASFLAARAIGRFLPDLTGAPPLAIAVAISALVATAAAAVLVPAWRATRVDPLTVLRS